MNDRDVKLLIGISLLAVLVAAGWYFRSVFLPRPEAVPAVSSETAAPLPVVADEGPRYPIAPPTPAESGQRDLIPLPPLDDSDAYFLLALADVLGADIETLLIEDALIDRFVTTIDNLPRDHVSEKVRPVGRLSQPFRVEANGEGAPMLLSRDNYGRYDALVSRLASADVAGIAETYQRFYPLFQQSYERLGYPGKYFNDRVVEVIDHLLETPQPDEPIRLVRPHVLYEFADPELQSLSSGQKLLLRMGNDHAMIVKKIMRELRAELAQSPETVLPAEPVLESD